MSNVTVFLGIVERAEVERRAGGNPSWNTGVDYGRQLITSPYAVEVAVLYRAAGLNLDTDLRKLNAGRRIAAAAISADCSAR